MEEPIEILTTEHGDIERLLVVLDVIAAMIQEGDAFPSKDIGRALAVITGFIDRCHHGKEDNVLFPAVSKASPSSGAELARRLASDHRAFRQLASSMNALLQRAQTEWQARGILAKDICMYTRLVRLHVRVEEDDLFKEVERTVKPSDRAKVTIEFERFEVEEIGRDAHKNHLETIDSLVKAYIR